MIRFVGSVVQMKLLKERLLRPPSDERWVARVMAFSGYGVVRIRAVTTMWNDSKEEGDKVGGDVLRVRPMVTDGSGDL